MVELHRYQYREWRELIDLWQRKQALLCAESAPDASWSNGVTVAVDEHNWLRAGGLRCRHMADTFRHIGISVDDLETWLLKPRPTSAKTWRH